MRVVLATGAFRGAINGASETVVTYAKHLRRSGHDVSVLLLYPPSRTNPYWRRLGRSGVTVAAAAPVDVERPLVAGGVAALRLRRMVPVLGRRVTDVGKSLLTTAADRHLRGCQRHLRVSGADLVHVIAQDAGTGVLVRAARAIGLPTLFHELGAGTRPSGLPGFASTLALCSEVAVLSPQIAERVGEVVPGRGRVSVLPIITEPPEGTAPARPPGPPSRSEGRSGPSSGSNGCSGVTFGFAGRLHPTKGALIMVEALALARAHVPGIRLRIAGRGPDERALMARARTLGVADACERVGTYAEPVERSSFMRSIDVLLLPSESEGTPNCIIEAMAHGLPVISTSVGGIPDVVTPNVGMLVPPRDPGALAQAMASLAHDKTRRARMGVAAVERYDRLFSPSSVMPLLLETYCRVAHDSDVPVAGTKHDWSRWADSK